MCNIPSNELEQIFYLVKMYLTRFYGQTSQKYITHGLVTV